MLTPRHVNMGVKPWHVEPYPRSMGANIHNIWVLYNGHETLHAARLDLIINTTQRLLSGQAGTDTSPSYERQTLAC